MRLQIRWINGWAYAHGSGPDGKRVRRALGTQDAHRAEEARANLEARLWKIKHYGPESVVTFDEAALAYAQDGKEARFLVKIAEQLSGKVLREITPKMIRDAARRAYPTAKNATINRQGIVPARAVLNYGHAQGWCAPIKVEGFPVDPPQKKAVGQTYLDALRPHLPDRAYALLMFLHYTGRRVGEAIAMRPEQITGTRVIFGKTKNGKPAVAVMPPQIAAMVAALDPIDGRVFGYAGRSSLYATMRRAAKKAGVEYLGTHQIGRHSFATALDNAGWTSKQIADAGGWESPALVQRTYVHTADTQEKAAKHLGKQLAKREKV
jgi:integrase